MIKLLDLIKEFSDKHPYILNISTIVILILNFTFVDIINFVENKVNPLILTTNKIYYTDKSFKFKAQKTKLKKDRHPFSVHWTFSERGLNESLKKKEIIQELDKFKIKYNTQDIEFIEVKDNIL